MAPVFWTEQSAPAAAFENQPENPIAAHQQRQQCQIVTVRLFYAMLRSLVSV